MSKDAAKPQESGASTAELGTSAQSRVSKNAAPPQERGATTAELGDGAARCEPSAAANGEVAGEHVMLLDTSGGPMMVWPGR